jgi:hypothetical protein
MLRLWVLDSTLYPALVFLIIGFEDAVELLGIANEKRPVSTVDGYSAAGLSDTVLSLADDFDDYGSVVNVDESSCWSGGLSLVIHVCWVRGFLG